MRIRVLCFLGKKHRQAKLFRKKRKTESYNVIQEGRRSFMTMMMKLVPVFAIAALYLRLSGDEGFKAGSWDEKDEGDFRRDFGRSQGVSDGRI